MPGVSEASPGARTVLVEFASDQVDRRGVEQHIRQFAPGVDGADDGREAIEIGVYYDGPDLAAVAEIVGLTPNEVVALHTEAEYTAAFCGFVPGFAYLTGLPSRLHVPRLAEPRVRVPAGSVAVADEFTGVYPRDSPGGWRLLGRTEHTLWDPAREPPAALTPGARVRFVPLERP
jgi:KipI family sensor histidine kinase inhibitor